MFVTEAGSVQLYESEIQKHMQIHESEDPYKRAYCNKSLAFEFDLVEY